MFDAIKEYTAPVDAQFQNYSERSTGLLKKFMKQACDTEKTDSLPVLLRSEMQFVCDLAASIVNKIPYGKSKNLITIAPADMLIFRPKEDYVPPRTKSKLQSINQMIQNFTIYRDDKGQK